MKTVIKIMKQELFDKLCEILLKRHYTSCRIIPLSDRGNNKIITSKEYALSFKDKKGITLTLIQSKYMFLKVTNSIE